MSTKQKRDLIRILGAAAMMAALFFVPHLGWASLVLYLIPYLLVGYDILREAWLGIVHRQPFDECLLMVIATLGALALGVYEQVRYGEGEFTEAVAVMLFYQVGEWFQSYAVGRSRRNISDLMDIRPDYANIEEDGVLRRVDPDEVEVGSLIVVQPGEKIPLDGTVEEGASTLDTAALTGESLPRETKPGEAVVSGCINLTGVLKIRTTKVFEESTVSKILELVEDASSRKSKSENFIARFARVYTPAVVLSAVALAILGPTVSLLLDAAPAWEVWAYRALSFLVASCPCALVISIPLTFFAGIGGASAQGVLVKGSNFMETLSRTAIVVFDKTGTLTQGAFQVASIAHSILPEQELLEVAALAESASSHPISKSLQAAWGGTIDSARVTDIHEQSGGGVLATVDGRKVLAGNDRLLEEHGVTPVPCKEVGTVIHLAIDGAYAGQIIIRDAVKEGAAEAIQTLKRSGVRQTVMLTGDRMEVAQRVAEELGLDQVYGQLLPGDKVTKVEALLAAKGPKEVLAFVGDGINDAPVLSRADIGIAMGAMGSDAAIEAADVVLMDDDPRKISKAIRISRKCLRIVYENIWMAIGIKLACLVLVGVGLASMWAAIFADVGVMVLAVLNAIRALWVKRL